MISSPSQPRTGWMKKPIESFPPTFYDEVIMKSVKNLKDAVSKLDLKKYEREGVDISLLTSSLTRTPTERAETNRKLLEFMEEAKKARAKLAHAHS